MASLAIKQVGRRQRNSLSQDLILDAAKEIVGSGGEISIRAVASKLKCTPMALYRHFLDKDQLLLALLDRIMEEVELPKGTEAWDSKLLLLAKNHLLTLQRNPWAIPLLFQNPDPGPTVRRIGEEFLTLLRAGGASKSRAVIVFSSLLALNYGWAGFTSTTSNHAEAAKRDRVNISLIPPAENEFPNTSSLWKEFEHLGSARYHSEAVKLLIGDLA